MADSQHTLLADAAQVGRGIFMGAANIVPGVSGGTVALVFGIYTRLVTAVSHCDLTLMEHLRHRRWAAAAAHCDLRFLAALGIGILVGTVGLASVMHTLLQDHRQQTLAVMFGMILASGWVVARTIRCRSRGHLAAAVAVGVLAALAAVWLVEQPFLQPRPGLGYLFLSGMVAICAMILPGISGAYILLILGYYTTVTGAIKEVASFHPTVNVMTTLVVFSAGCAIGLIGFSQILRRLLAHFHAMTMAVLCGLMIGSLRKIWPFQIDTTPASPLKEKIFVSYWPQWDRSVALSLALVLVSLAAVIVVERLVAGADESPRMTEQDHG